MGVLKCVGVVKLGDEEMRVQMDTKVIDAVVDDISKNSNDSVIFHLIIGGRNNVKVT